MRKGILTSQEAEDIRELKQRMTAVELGLATVAKQLGLLAEADAQANVRFDRVGDRLERIERRLELIEPPPSAAE